MPAPSALTTIVFVGLVAVVALLLARAVRRAGTGMVATLGIAVAYLVVPGALAWAGALDRYDARPPPPLLVPVVLILLTTTLALSPWGKRVAASVGVRALVGLQVFRLPVELLLHRMYGEGVVPVQMTFAGRNFDVVTAVVALVLALWMGRCQVPRGVVLAWNILGIALLANIVTIAILSTPGASQIFPGTPPNLLPSAFPFVWLPSFLVQVALASHLLLFRLLGRGPDRRDDREAPV
jgi:hypothetical protein